jgi:hypothetical protein
MTPSNRSPFAPLNRGLFLTRLVMIWERLLPALTPFIVLALLIAVAGQWGLFDRLPTPSAHAAVLIVGFVLAFIAAVRSLRRFRMPGFTEINTRLAHDNGLKPETLIALRHRRDQPRLKVGKPKAGLATGDPFALRYVALAAAIFGFLLLGPVPLSQVEAAFCPTAHNLTLASR